MAGRSQSWDLPAGTLAFTYCAMPVCYELADDASIAIERASGVTERVAGPELTAGASAAVFARDGSIDRLTVRVARRELRLDAVTGRG